MNNEAIPGLGISETERLRHERDHLRLLVEVTNAVISRQDPAELIGEIAIAIRQFFGTDYLSLDLLDSTSRQVRSHSICFLGDHSRLQGSVIIPVNASLANRVFQSKTPLLAERGELERLARDTDQASQITARSLNCVCVLPLLSRQQDMLGALTLAHEQPGAFPAYKLSVLKEIAARIAIGRENAQAYEEISHLKDRLASENLYLNEEIRSIGSFGEIIGESTAMQTVLEQVEMVASSDCTVLILGETGTGKELIARAIHTLSTRKAGSMVKINCAAIPAGLLESDLFGHEKGAFTGAASQRLGRFELADKGSLFLDEIGDLPLELQPKLLRALQEHEIERLGGHRAIPVDARVIAATNRDLTEMVTNREFRSDLYYRLNVFPIVIPPLRERPEDIPQLARYFVRKIALRMNRQIDSIPSEALQHLATLSWPGNVRELENVIERAVLLTRGSVLKLPLNELHYHLTPITSHKARSAVVTATPTPEPLADASDSERQKIIRILRETNGIVAGPRGAAARLGLKRTTLLSRMQRLGISSREINNSTADEV